MSGGHAHRQVERLLLNSTVSSLSADTEKRCRDRGPGRGVSLTVPSVLQSFRHCFTIALHTRNQLRRTAQRRTFLLHLTGVANKPSDRPLLVTIVASFPVLYCHTGSHRYLALHVLMIFKPILRLEDRLDVERTAVSRQRTTTARSKSGYDPCLLVDRL
nr:hypothetical protein CFP56_73817 [Quercus suber]